jgi:hypothetical protein
MHCRTVFTVPVSSHRRACSRKCSNRSYSRRKARLSGQPERELSGQPEQCRRCGKPISSTSPNPRLWCSDTCRMAARRAGPAGEDDPADWIPAMGARRTADAVQRRNLIRSWAAQGYSSRQMSGRLGMRAEDIRRIARAIGVSVPADEIIRRTHRHDSASIIRETAQTLEGLVMGVSLVSFDDDIDPAEAKTWATSLSGSLRVLSQFANQVKEMTQ